MSRYRSQSLLGLACLVVPSHYAHAALDTTAPVVGVLLAQDVPSLKPEQIAVTEAANTNPTPPSAIPTEATSVPPVQSNAHASAPMTATTSAAAPMTSKPRPMPVSAGDWGMVGLLQTPSARMQPVGSFGLTFSRATPYTQTTLFLQPFENIELGMRYSVMSNISYGGSTTIRRSNYDKSMEIKWRAVQEGKYRPAIAIGLRDPVGTGLFSGEYVVANKQYGDWDLSLGLGWGYTGARGSLRNPLGVFAKRFDTRGVDDIGNGGLARTKSWFTGRTSPFAGVQWHTPYEPLTVKLEYDGNNYENEPFNTHFEQRSPINVGVVWQKAPYSLSVGFERGNTWMLSLSIGTDLKGIQRFERKPQPVVAILPHANTETPSAHTYANTLRDFSSYSSWTARNLRADGTRWVVEVERASGTYVQERLKDGIAILHRDAPAHIQTFVVQPAIGGVPIQAFVVDRAQWVQHMHAPNQHAQPGVGVANPEDTRALPSLASKPTQALTGKVDLDYSQSIGGPDGYLYGVYAQAQARAALWRGAWVDGKVRYRLLSNYGDIQAQAPSNLPRVRTDRLEYLKQSRVTIPYLQLSQLYPVGKNVHVLAYAGLLESMYAGAGAEVLYRPNQARWAIGLDINRVQQRDFKQGFKLRDYRATTGHLTGYWDTQWKGVQAALSVGQYLAGDRGATLDVSRTFNNGVTMGVWATKTNISSQEFGEGSFDKGVYLSLPIEALIKRSGGRTKIVYHPLLRDGGAKLFRQVNLWDLTYLRDTKILDYAHGN